MPTSATLFRQCAWCGRQVTEDSKPIGQALPLDAVEGTTHGVCVVCLERVLSEYAKRRQPKATTA